MYSPAMSRFSSSISRRYSWNWSQMVATGMSVISTWLTLTRWRRRSSGPSKTGRCTFQPGGGRDSLTRAPLAHRLEVGVHDVGEEAFVVDAADLRRPALHRHPLLHVGGRDQLVELVEVADLGAAGIAAPLAL